jgi:hypothetical protein
LRDPIAQIRHSIRDKVEVEPAQDASVVGDEHIVGVFTAFLRLQQSVYTFDKSVEELVAAVRDR